MDQSCYHGQVSYGGSGLWVREWVWSAFSSLSPHEEQEKGLYRVLDSRHPNLQNCEKWISLYRVQSGDSVIATRHGLGRSAVIRPSVSSVCLVCSTQPGAALGIPQLLCYWGTHTHTVETTCPGAVFLSIGERSGTNPKCLLPLNCKY